MNTDKEKIGAALVVVGGAYAAYEGLKRVGTGALKLILGEAKEAPSEKAQAKASEKTPPPPPRPETVSEQFAAAEVDMAALEKNAKYQEALRLMREAGEEVAEEKMVQGKKKTADQAANQ